MSVSPPSMEDTTAPRQPYKAPMKVLTAAEQQQEQYRRQLAMLDLELKDWFLTRRLKMERNIALKKLFDRYNFMGFSMNNPSIPDAQKVLWNDLVQGKPQLEGGLSLDAREMKADMYMRMFKNATDLENPCRIPGVTYLRCLRDHLEENEMVRSTNCLQSFSSFDACRKALLLQQDTAMRNSLSCQHSEDLHAKALFEERCKLMNQLTGR